MDFVNWKETWDRSSRQESLPGKGYIPMTRQGKAVNHTQMDSCFQKNIQKQGA